jgi:hypothetical protein
MFNVFTSSWYSGLSHSIWPFSIFDLINYVDPQLALKVLCGDLNILSSYFKEL